MSDSWRRFVASALTPYVAVSLREALAQGATCELDLNTFSVKLDEHGALSLFDVNTQARTSVGRAQLEEALAAVPAPTSPRPKTKGSRGSTG